MTDEDFLNGTGDTVCLPPAVSVYGIDRLAMLLTDSACHP